MQAEEEEADEGEQQQKRKGFTTDEESSLVSTPPANAAGTRKRGGARPRGRFILFFLHGRAPNVFPQRACSHTYLHTRTNHLHRRTCTYIHVLTSTHKYLQVLNALARTYKYLQVLTRTYTYLQVLTSTYTYLQVLAHMYNLLAVRCLPARSLPMPRQRGDHTSALAHDTPTASPSFRSRFQNGLRNVSKGVEKKEKTACAGRCRGARLV